MTELESWNKYVSRRERLKGIDGLTGFLSGDDPAMTYAEAEAMRHKLETALVSTSETKSPDNFKKVSKEYTADQWAECGILILRNMEKDRLHFLKLLAAAEILGVREGGGPALADFCYNSAYRQGYLSAVLAVVNWWEDHSDNITYYRYTNYKLVDLLLNKVLKNWETLMKYGDVEVTVTREEYEGCGKKWHSRKNKRNKEAGNHGKNSV